MTDDLRAENATLKQRVAELESERDELNGNVALREALKEKSQVTRWQDRIVEPDSHGLYDTEDEEGARRILFWNGEWMPMPEDDDFAPVAWWAPLQPGPWWPTGGDVE